MSRYLDITVQLPLFHRILVEAGTSNTVSLSHEDRTVARFLLLALELETPTLIRSIGRHEVQGIERRLKTALAPHKLLPPELLHKIFRYVGCGTPLFYPARGATYSFQWSLRHVCSTWRKIAISDPLLWRCICFRVKHLNSHRDFPLHHRRIGFWNKNIANIFDHLRVFLVGTPVVLQPVSRLIYETVLRPNAWRIEEITVGCTRLLFPFDQKSSPVFFSRLKRLCYYFPRDIFGIMPQIIPLKVSISPISNIQWHCLTDLVICTAKRKFRPRRPFLSLADAFVILKLCCELRHCTLQVGENHDNIASPPINLPHLHSLRVYQLCDGRIHDFLLDWLVAPSLIALAYYAIGTADSVGLSRILPFIRRSRCQLEDIILDSEIWTTHEDCSIETFCELVPCLRTFFAPNYLAYHGLLSTISETPLLPRIERIGISRPKSTANIVIDLSKNSASQMDSFCHMVFCRKHTKSQKFELEEIIPWDDRLMKLDFRTAMFSELTGMTRGWNDTTEGHFWFE